MKKEKISIVSRSFFLFASFSFFEAGCGNLKKIHGRPGPGYEYSTQPHDG
jgi:hypothetical protein